MKADRKTAENDLHEAIKLRRESEERVSHLKDRLVELDEKRKSMITLGEPADSKGLRALRATRNECAADLEDEKDRLIVLTAKAREADAVLRSAEADERAVKAGVLAGEIVQASDAADAALAALMAALKARDALARDLHRLLPPNDARQGPLKRVFQRQSGTAIFRAAGLHDFAWLEHVPLAASQGKTFGRNDRSILAGTLPADTPPAAAPNPSPANVVVIKPKPVGKLLPVHKGLGRWYLTDEKGENHAGPFGGKILAQTALEMMTRQPEAETEAADVA